MAPIVLQMPGYSFALRFDEVTSTMDIARERSLALLGFEGGAGLICARRQTAGRGRQGRSWSGMGDSFMGTFLFATSGAVHLFSGYSLAVGCAVAQALASLGVLVALKWPNDIVSVRGGELSKLGGILIEVQDLGLERVMLVGIGINVMAAPSGVPGAASLHEVSGKRLSPEELEAPLAHSLLAMHRRFVQAEGFKKFSGDWMSRSCLVPGTTSLSVDVGTRVVDGTFEGVDRSGALLLSTDDGLEAIVSGHVLSLSGLRDTH